MSYHVLARADRRAPARHYSTHAPLLRRLRPGGRPRLDAIVVSAARPACNVRPALRLGAELDVPVLLLCSGEARKDEAQANVEDICGADCTIVDLSGQPELGLPEFETSGFSQARYGAHGDLSHKRNLALALGRLAGWRTLLFLDDDIFGLEPVKVRRAAAALDHHTAIGMPALEFPDNSVVCHAHRRSGNEQGVFVSGSALAVDLRRADTFFPQIYNEDWVFLAPHLDRRDVAAVGSVRQQAYAPFADPHRAGAQEFGEVLAEGLIGFLHSARLRTVPTLDYWQAFLDERARFIALTTAGCVAAAALDALPPLQFAERARSEISPAALIEYVSAWLHDLVAWRRFIVELPRVGGLAASIRYLDLQDVTVASQSRASVPAAEHHIGHAVSRRLCSE